MAIKRSKMPWLLPAVSLASSVAFAASGISSNELDGGNQAKMTAAEKEAVVNYWTEEKMESAIPMPGPVADRITDTGDPGELDRSASSQIGESAGFAPGWSPRSGQAQPAWDDYVYLDELATYEGQDPNIQAQANTFGSPPSDPLNGPYAPFQRRSLLGRYLNYPRSVIGKYYFTLNGGNYVCSASVIHRNTLATAGHCNHAGGSGGFATNRLFCPSYNQNGVNANRGCWPVVNSKTNNLWVSTGDPDRDHACLITDTEGTVYSNSVGNVTGWAGRAWNWGPSQATESFGYAAASPFDGTLIIQASGPEWYEVDFSPASSSHKSKCIGSDLTGGSSGGPWYLSWNNPSFEKADSDGNPGTDPASSGGPHINGVNSHKRCTGGTCQSPPTATAGVFWQEMCSPPFRNTDTDANESEDVFAVCFDNGGT